MVTVHKTNPLRPLNQRPNLPWIAECLGQSTKRVRRTLEILGLGEGTGTRAIAAALKKPLWLPPVPGFLLKILLGEMANMVLYGAKVSPEKIQEMEFKFQFIEINTALENLLGLLRD